MSAKARHPQVAIVVRHFPGEGRLSGLVTFSRELVKELGRTATVTVISGRAPGSSWQPLPGVLHVQVRAPFWLRAWPHLDSARHDQVVILSGIHHPRWAALLAMLLRRCPLPAPRRLLVQAVTLDHPWSPRQAAGLRAQARIATLNPAEGRRLRPLLPDLVVTTPGIDLASLSEGPIATRNSSFRIGFFGHLNQVKGADRLPAILEAIAPGDWDCVIAGIGPLSDELGTWAANRRNVAIHGYLHDRLSMLRSCDVLLAPFRQSATVLGISQIVLEAIGCGIPVVATPVEAITGAVSHDAEALIADTDEALAASLQRLMDNPPQRIRMRQAALSRSRQFSIQGVAAGLMAAFQDAPGRYGEQDAPA